jgi:hypothetical protein
MTQILFSIAFVRFMLLTALLITCIASIDRMLNVGFSLYYLFFGGICPIFVAYYISKSTEVINKVMSLENRYNIGRDRTLYIIFLFTSVIIPFGIYGIIEKNKEFNIYVMIVYCLLAVFNYVSRQYLIKK